MLPTPAAVSAPRAAATAKPPPLVVSGRVRYYSFARSYKTGSTNQSATAAALQLHLETPAHDGLGFGLTYYDTQPIADGAIIPSELESSLPGTRVSTLAEAYGQFENVSTLVRVGRQTLNTPWANPADSRLIPITYEGAGLAQKLSSEWTLFAYRILRVKNRTVPTFANTSFVTTQRTGGFSAIGFVQTTARAKLQFWDYRFDNISNLAYADATRTLLKTRRWHAWGALQAGVENGSRSQALGVASGHLYGAQVGGGSRTLELALAYDRVPVAAGSYKNGAFVSPYTYGDSADPLFAKLIGTSLVEKASPGQAYVLSSTYTSPNGRFKGIAARGRLDLLTSPSVPKNELYETDADVAYDVLPSRGSKDVRGLWVHERWFSQDTTVKPFWYSQNRFYVDYTW